MMATAEDIFEVVSLIVARYQPQSIVLFGSYVYGRPTPDSDVDLLVKKDFAGSPHHQFVRLRRLLDVRFPIDLLVRRQGEVADRIRSGDCFLNEVESKGIVLHEEIDPGVGRKGRRRLRRRLAPSAVAQAEPVRPALSRPLSG